MSSKNVSKVWSTEASSFTISFFFFHFVMVPVVPSKGSNTLIIFFSKDYINLDFYLVQREDSKAISIDSNLPQDTVTSREV